MLSAAFGPYPVQHRRGDRRQPRRPVLRARDPDALGVLEVLLARPAGQPHERRLRRRPRDGPPVVRRRRGAGPLAGHLAQRGIRHLRRVAVGRVRGPGDARRVLPGHLRRLPGRRPVLDRHDRRPRRHGPVLEPRVLPWRHDPARPPRGRGRRRVLGDHPRVGGREQRRERHHRAVHRPGRGGVRPAARRPVHDVAVHPGAARPRGGRRRCRRGGDHRGARRDRFGCGWLAAAQARLDRGRY